MQSAASVFSGSGTESARKQSLDGHIVLFISILRVYLIQVSVPAADVGPTPLPKGQGLFQVHWYQLSLAAVYWHSGDTPDFAEPRRSETIIEKLSVPSMAQMRPFLYGRSWQRRPADHW